MTYHFRVVAANAGGTSYGNDMTFMTLPVVPAVITNLASNITSTGGQLNGTVTAFNAPTTVTFEYGQTTAYGSVINGTPGSVTGMNPTAVNATLSGLLINTTYHFRCKGVNVAGTAYGLDQQFTTNCIAPVITITGPSTVCAGSTGVVYTTETGYNNYQWTVSGGGLITGGAGTSSITVSWNTAGAQTVSVNYQNSYGCSAPSPTVQNVTVNPQPSPAISGPNPVCQFSTGNVYTTQTGYSNYDWTISPGGLITAGFGTNAITVTWNSTGVQNVSVNYTNASGCSASAPTVYNVTVNEAPLPTITGITELCINSGNYTYTTESGNSNYNWTVSSGGTITSGQGTNQIQVSWSISGGQSVRVNYANSFGCQAPVPTTLYIMVNPLPEPAGPITGTPELCAGTTDVIYSTPPITSAYTYVWTLPAGATIVSGAGTNSITVDFAPDAVSGDITVYGNNFCGNGTASSYAVTVDPVPSAPVITLNGNELVSNAVTGNQWYKEGALIPGATGQTWDATQTGNGWYWDMVTLNGCPSDTSNHIYVLITGIGETKGSSFVIYPVPNDGRFTISLPAGISGECTINVLNDLGMQVFTEKQSNMTGHTTLEVDLRPIPAGSYIVYVRANDQWLVRKILVTR